MYNGHSKLNGFNLSCFHHPDEHWTAGLKCIRFFPTHIINNEEELTLAAWDIELNAHYNIKLTHDWTFYPLAGIGHTSEKETTLGENHYARFWSLNTGFGIGYEKGHWGPHIELNRSWGKINQQFFLAGISYELEWK